MSFVGPSYSPQLVVETDGLVQSGNVVALVDKLSGPWISGDHMTIDREKTFQDVFLMTFRTFITVEELLQMLIGDIARHVLRIYRPRFRRMGKRYRSNAAPHSNGAFGSVAGDDADSDGKAFHRNVDREPGTISLSVSAALAYAGAPMQWGRFSFITFNHPRNSDDG
ncbi:hypothetical protein B0H13DRAFT_2306622 [Mycena leptocephala]|nr:hypothetical protein B0H13DRAFT_2306622 [Mycena leptocephala]